MQSIGLKRLIRNESYALPAVAGLLAYAYSQRLASSALCALSAVALTIALAHPGRTRPSEKLKGYVWKTLTVSAAALLAYKLRQSVIFSSLVAGTYSYWLSKLPSKKRIVEPQKANNERIPFPAFGVDVNKRIFSYLSSKDLLTISPANKAWNDLASRNELWEAHYKTDFFFRLQVPDGYRPALTGNLPIDWKEEWLVADRASDYAAKALQIFKIRGYSYCLAIQDKYLAAGPKNDSTVLVWDLENGQLAHTLQGHQRAVSCINFQGNYIITGSKDCNAIVWNLKSGLPLHTLHSPGYQTPINHMVTQGEYLITANSVGTLIVWNWESGLFLHTLQDSDVPINAMAINENCLVTASCNGSVKVWDFKNNLLLHTLKDKSPLYSSMPDDQGSLLYASIQGQQLITVGTGKIICIWDLVTGQLTHQLTDEKGMIGCAAIQGPYLATSSYASTNGKDGWPVIVWDLANKQRLHVLRGHKDRILCMAISGKYLVTGSADNTAIVWDLEHGKRLYTLVNHRGKITKVFIQGKYIITGSEDGTAMRWPFKPD
jgi:WD40 repeat protein